MKLGVDICNTIANVNAEIARVRGARDWRPEQYGLESMEVRDAEAFFRAHPSVFVDAAPLLGAREALRALARSAEIFYVTSRPLWAREITERWLRANGFPQGALVAGAPKALAVRRFQLQAFVEDDPGQIAALNPLCKVYAPGWPYNGSGLVWREIGERLLFLGRS